MHYLVSTFNTYIRTKLIISCMEKDTTTIKLDYQIKLILPSCWNKSK